MLKTRIFRGCYQERRYVEHLNGYRDLIIINKQENDLIKDLGYLRNRINDFYQNDNKWIGITIPNMIGTPAGGTCIWTEITNIPLGEHWFYLKTIKFRNNEIAIKLQQLRSIDDDNDNISSMKSRKLNTKNDNNDDNDENNVDVNNDATINDFINLFTSWNQSIKITLYSFLSHDINKKNIISTLKFLGLIIISLLTFTIEAIKFIGIYSLRFMAELRLWIQTCTPIILTLIDLISKLIGGFYILIAMLWRDAFGGGGGGNRTQNNINFNMLPSPPGTGAGNYHPRYLTSTEYYRNLHGNNNNNRDYLRKKLF